MPPIGFDNCRKNGGKIRTKELSGGTYIHICILNGKSYAGEVKSKKAESKSPVADAIARRMK